MILENLKHAPVDISTSGDNVIITAPSGGTGNYYAIDFLQVFAPVAVGVTFKHGPAGGPYTPFGGKYAFAAGQNITIENSMMAQYGALTCGDNEAFVISLDASQQLSGFIRYRNVGNG